MSDIQKDLDALFDAERSARRLVASLVACPREELVGTLARSTKAALALTGGGDEDEASLRLVRLAGVLGELDGAEVVDLLVDILDGDAPDARVAAGEALEALAFDRFKEVALGIERALARLPQGSPALTELPFLLAEVAEPGCVKLLGRFLSLPDADAVAAAIEAMAELGDPAAGPLLAPLERDGRHVVLDEESSGTNAERVTIGELAQEARELLEELGASMNGPSDRGRGDRERGDRSDRNKRKR